jgi:hypothetical protein
MTPIGRARLSVAEGERRGRGRPATLGRVGEKGRGKGLGRLGRTGEKGKGSGSSAGPRGERERGREKGALKCILI